MLLDESESEEYTTSLSTNPTNPTNPNDSKGGGEGDGGGEGGEYDPLAAANYEALRVYLDLRLAHLYHDGAAEKVRYIAYNIATIRYAAYTIHYTLYAI